VQRTIFLYSFLIFLVLILLFAVTGDYFVRRSLVASVEVQLEQEMQELFKKVMDEITSAGRSEGGRELDHVRAVIDNFRLGKGFGRSAYGWLLEGGSRWNLSSSRARVFFPLYLAEDKRDLVERVRQSPAAGMLKLGSGATERLISYKALPEKSWIVGITYPLGEMSRFYGAVRARMAMLFGCLVVIAVLLCLILSHHVAGPFALLGSYAKLIAAEESPEAPAPSRFHEAQTILEALAGIQTLLAEQERLDINQLTGLPGNKALQQALFESIDRGREFAVVYVDINNFSGYNNRYGFDRGDSVIRFAGTLITNSVKEVGNKDDFIAHLGADKFCFITTPAKAEAICDRIIKTFDEQISHYYTPEDRERGYLVSKDRQGNIRKFGFMTIILAIATNEQRPLIHPLQIAHITTEIAEFLKTSATSKHLKDRRTTEREGPEEEVQAPQEEARQPTASEPRPNATAGEKAASSETASPVSSEGALQKAESGEGTKA
jgi:diguanylate cyclase (GGDEF)-like protein